MQNNKLLFQSILLGCILEGLSFLLSNSLQGASNYSCQFIGLSIDPFAKGQPQQYRFLIPLIGFLTGLKGNNYYIMSLIGNTFFLIMVNYWASKFYQNRLTAFLLASCMACLPVVLLNNSWYAWSDVYCYAFLLLALLYPKFCPLIIFLGLSSHEFFGMYFPFICLYYYRYHHHCFEDKKIVIKIMVGLLIAFASYGLIRWWFTSHSAPALSIAYYIYMLPNRGLFCELRGQPLLAGLITAYKTSIILFVPFIYFALRYIKSKMLDILLLLSALIPLSLLFIAHDTTRFFSHTFIFILFFPKYIQQFRNSLLAFILISSILIPSFVIAFVSLNEIYFLTLNLKDDEFSKILNSADEKRNFIFSAPGSSVQSYFHFYTN